MRRRKWLLGVMVLTLVFCLVNLKADEIILKDGSKKSDCLISEIVGGKVVTEKRLGGASITSEMSFSDIKSIKFSQGDIRDDLERSRKESDLLKTELREFREKMQDSLKRKDAKIQKLSGEIATLQKRVRNLEPKKETQSKPVYQRKKSSFVQPSSYGAGTPERALAQFLNKWKAKRWREMVSYVQKTWAAGQKDPADMLKAWFDFKQLERAEILGRKSHSKVMVDVKFRIHYKNFGTKQKSETYTARIIRETKAYEPSQRGDWGVNPVTILSPRK